jgi:hypothetical protein
MDIDKIISIVRTLKEEGAIANVVGTGGLTSSSTPPGRMDGYDKVMGFVRRKPPTIIGKGKYPGARKRWSKNKPSQ